MWVTRFASDNLVKYDANGDGELDKKECRPFIEDMYERIREEHKSAHLPPLRHKRLIEMIDDVFERYD